VSIKETELQALKNKSEMDKEMKTKHRQCAGNAILRRFRATIVTEEKQQVLHILSVCL
jgi:hypothetical protein